MPLVFIFPFRMFDYSYETIPRTIGYGKGGVIDKMLHGSDSRHIEREKKEKSPSLQTVFYRSLVREVVTVTMLDGTELIGTLTNVLDDGARIILDGRLIQTKRIRFVAPNGEFDPVSRIPDYVSFECSCKCYFHASAMFIE